MAGASLLASMLVRPNEKLAAMSGVLMAAASAAGTHGEDVHLEDVHRFGRSDKDAVMGVAHSLDPSVVDVACAPRAVFVHGVDGERRTGPGRRGRSSLCAP
jgi:hypothetical protein